ncbi:T9SS type A sorting domain-containing protein [Hymenobacter endophyticus]|uniref:T9SS type A sorting domain-containing protein n=1 Tax=Hymenobacter endophyticus TaxID=3076335 RepID=UPI00362088E1
MWAGKEHFNNTNPTTATVTATTAPYTPIGVYSTRNGLGGTALTYIYFEENVQCPPGGGGSASRTSAYPNPSASDLTVDYEPAPGRQDAELVLHNSQGTIVQTFRYPGNSQRRTFPIRGLNRGLYYLRTVENGRTQGTLRLVIE